MKLIDNKNGKEINYKFEGAEVRSQYIEICLEIWGCVPCDVNWAMSTNLYKSRVNKEKF